MQAFQREILMSPDKVFGVLIRALAFVPVGVSSSKLFSKSLGVKDC